MSTIFVSKHASQMLGFGGAGHERACVVRTRTGALWFASLYQRKQPRGAGSLPARTCRLHERRRNSARPKVEPNVASRTPLPPLHRARAGAISASPIWAFRACGCCWPMPQRSPGLPWRKRVPPFGRGSILQTHFYLCTQYCGNTCWKSGQPAGVGVTRTRMRVHPHP